MLQWDNFHPVPFHLFSRTLQLITKRENSNLFISQIQRSVSRILVSQFFICHWGNFVAVLLLSTRSVKEKNVKKKRGKLKKYRIPAHPSYNLGWLNLSQTSIILFFFPSKANCPKRVNCKSSSQHSIREVWAFLISVFTFIPFVCNT